MTNPTLLIQIMASHQLVQEVVKLALEPVPRKVCTRQSVVEEALQSEQ
jgi:hypothetical protein